MKASLDPLQLGRLLDLGRSVVAKLDVEEVLDQILEAAREITGARYAALGVLNERRTELERFFTAGIDADARGAIGDLPRGRGVLGVLIDDPRPLRLSDVGHHPQSYGFPDGHPPMSSFLGVPILIGGEPWGNLYLTEKEGGEFTEADEQAVGVLADWAVTAIGNARLYETSERRRADLERAVRRLEATHERRRADLERAVRGLEATHDIATAIGSAASLERVLELIVKRGRALIDATTVVIMLREEDELVVVAGAGHAIDMHGVRLPIDKSTSGRVLERGRAERISDVANRLGIDPAKFGVPDAHTALLVPMTNRGRTLGVLAAFDRGLEHDVFSEEDEQLLRTFAATAANAVAMAQSVEADRLRSAIAAADAERQRWGRELHDETLQGLGGLRVLLASALQRGDPDEKDIAMREAIEDIETAIGNLRSIITDLRPSVRPRRPRAAGGAQRADRAPRTRRDHDRRRAGSPRPSGRRGSAEPRARGNGLPSRPGGANERRQTRAREQGPRVRHGRRMGGDSRGAGRRRRLCCRGTKVGLWSRRNERARLSGGRHAADPIGQGGHAASCAPAEA